jgi:predicted ABC-type transport system involved in lysophospholipase L1 biosynthesis ATPase subunit
MPRLAIKASGLEKWFGEGEAKTLALRGVEFEADFGEMVYIVRPSWERRNHFPERTFRNPEPNSGSVQVEGTDIWTLNSDQLAEFRRNKIGFAAWAFSLEGQLRAGRAPDSEPSDVPKSSLSQVTAVTAGQTAFADPRGGKEKSYGNR